MELVTIEIDLMAGQPVRIRRMDVERITNGYVYTGNGGALRRKRLFLAETDSANRGTYILISGGEHATDDEIRLGVEEVTDRLARRLRECGDTLERVREELLGFVNE